MKKIYSLLIVVGLAFNMNAQNEGNWWYFGENAVIDFNSGNPVSNQTGSLFSFEASASISDRYGNLLFYTDGNSVWNALNNGMPNGLGLGGSTTSSQCMILPFLGNYGKYIIVTTSNGSGMAYTIVDMTLETGLGDVVSSQNNITFGNPNNTNNILGTEKVAIYYRENLNFAWIVSYADGIYYSYKIENGVINTTPVISNLTSFDVLTDFRGVLKFSPDGSKLVNTAIGDVNKGLIANFNPSSGLVSNQRKLSTLATTNRFYGAEFSPNSRYLYLNASNTDSGNSCGPNNTRNILQYDTALTGQNALNNPTAIIQSTLSVNSGRGALQLGPDGKIYQAVTCQPWLDRIENPNASGASVIYTENAVSLFNNNKSREGLPGIYVQQYQSAYNIVKGKVILDIDNNGCSPTDPVFSNLTVFSSVLGNNTRSVSTDVNGDYTLYFPDVTTTIDLNLENPSYWIYSPNPATINFPAQVSPFTQDFCVTANGSVQDLEVIVVPLELARPGFVTDYKVIVKNKGNQTSSGTVSLNFEENFMTLASTNPTAGNSPSNQLNWSFSNLQPFQMEEFLFSMTLNTPTQATNPLNGGDRLLFTGNVNVSTGTDAMPTDNTMTLDQLVVNSFDPNDKTCLEGETIEPSQVGNYVHYIIRFENTGTASAVNVVVKDVIDTAKFDITTLVPLGGSDNYYTRILDDNVVEFIHEDINLDFNDATNDGYVLFKIKTLSTLVSGDTFDNQAQIYFDFNAPIITNNESVLVQSTASIAETTDASIRLFPNPAGSSLNLRAISSINKLNILDASGRVISTAVFAGNSNEHQVDISNLSSGIYFATIQSNTGSSTIKFIKE